MELSDEPLASSPEPPRAHPTGADRAVALLEVLLCSEYPTQIVIAQALTVVGFHQQNSDGSLNVSFVAMLSLVDAAVLIGLILLLIAARGDRPSQVLFGSRPAASEAVAGIGLMFASLLVAAAVLIAIQLVAPGLRTVEHNPLQDLLRTPRNAAIFGLVVIVAGGVREEVQRAFLLNRFERWLGGGLVGIVVISIGFGLGHKIQGWDAVVATGVLGALWGVVYLRRRSIVAPMVAHAGFDLLQLAQFLVIGR